MMALSRKRTWIFAGALVLAFGVFDCVDAASSGNSAYTYLPLEPIPGFDEAVDFPQYVSALYKFGIWTVGIAALLMLSVGGFMYMTSAGNNSRIEAAKTVIYDSLWGLIVAMFAWLLLFIINPDLVSGTLNFRKVKLGTYSGPAASVAAGVSPAGVAIPADCKTQQLQDAFKKYAQQYGIDKCLIQATSQWETGCNVNIAVSAQGDSGVMHIQPSTAKRVCGLDQNQLFNYDANIGCAAKILADCARSGKVSKSPEDLFLREVRVCYNSPGLLDQSQDCAGQKKYQCAINDGGNSPTSARAVREAAEKFPALYYQCKNGD